MGEGRGREKEAGVEGGGYYRGLAGWTSEGLRGKG